VVNVQSLAEFKDLAAEWIQPSVSERSYQLQSGEFLLGRLFFRSSFGTLAVAETAEGRWTFKRVGFLNPRVTARVADSGEDLAVYQPKFWGDGVLTFMSGPVFTWKPINFWATDWAFADAQESPLIAFKGGVAKEKLRDIFKIQSTVEVVAAPQGRDVFSVLLALGMYLLVLHHQDAAAAAAATAGGAAS
jgi:hypothetical protein